ncbi:cell division transport system permease protein [Noviherbaspirillum humi]|uniref:Cell division protein FtsX n=1 Tax=Noviherbaspirillum humi TaxID=1688639 RepID=A0A239CIH2_9BURK|nr:permease-like cell division protein FtsX [Noviherbaspirillum humi]SNS20026.1 cell division transport system permease protein [Noviherbaspirillum humi]
MSIWMRQQAAALGDAFRQIRRMPGSFLLNVLVIAIALSLPFAGLTVLESVRPVSEQIAVEPEISLFLSVDTPRERAAALAPQIRRVLQQAQAGGKLEFIPREQALGNLKNKSGLSEALTVLGENPLPDAYVLKVSARQDAGQAAKIESIAAQLKALPGVEYVQVDSAWVKRLAALMAMLKIGLLFVGATLGVVVVAVIFNTVRLQILTQREEIEVCRLFGATDAFVRRPFFYCGALLGLVAGVISLAIVAGMLLPLNAAVAELARLYSSQFALSSLGADLIALLLAGSAALGLLGAMLSIRQHLR